MTEPQINENLLDKKLEALEKNRSWSPRLISKLETLIRTGDDESLFRINPVRYAAEKNITEGEAIDLFLYSAKHGLFEMEWQLVCPMCGHIVNSLGDLSSVHGHIQCDTCALETDITLDDYILVTFSISRQVRQISFHNPETLSAEDLHYKYLYYRDAGLIAPGVTHADFLRLITRMTRRVIPGEKTVVEIEPAGLLLARDMLNKNAFVTFAHIPDNTADSVRLHLQLKGDKFQTGEVSVTPLAVELGGMPFIFPAFGQIPHGKVRIELENQTDASCPINVLQYPADLHPKYLELDPSLSGKRLLTNQTFRDLFRNETVQHDEGIGIKDITFLFTDLKSSTAMYDSVGDSKAYFLVRQHFEILSSAVASNNGAIVKTIGDAIMATFMSPIDALKAAVKMIQGIQEFNRSGVHPLHLKIGIHRGHSIAVTLDERLDYFGQTVNIAARVQGLADADEIYMTREAYQGLNNHEILSACVMLPEQVSVKGVSDTLNVHKLTLSEQVNDMP